MTKIAIPLILAGLTTILLAVPITDQQNQRNTLFSIVPNQKKINGLRMQPIQLRENSGLNCPQAGYFTNPMNCSHFYRCVDVADTGYFSIRNFECPTGQVFSQTISTCVPGSCSSTGSSSSQGGGVTPQGPPAPYQPITDPTPQGPPAPNQPINDPTPQGPPSPNQPMNDGTPSDSLITTHPAPPPSPTGTFEPPQWMTQLPPWFNEVPWWFKTPPAWFNQPPAWLNALPAGNQEITIDVIDDSEPLEPHIDVMTGKNYGKIRKEIASASNISISGIDNTFLHDNKTIQIHIPIHIIQQ